MTTQLPLALDPMVTPVYNSDATIHERFAAMLTEVLRWHHGRATVGDEFKLNNNFRSRYVRLMIARHPEWASAFTLRELKSL